MQTHWSKIAGIIASTGSSNGVGRRLIRTVRQIGLVTSACCLLGCDKVAEQRGNGQAPVVNEDRPSVLPQKNADEPLDERSYALRVMRARLRSSAKIVIDMLHGLQICRINPNHDARIAEKIASRAARFDRLSRLADEAGLSGDLPAARADLVMRWSVELRGCDIRTFLLDPALEALDRAADDLERHIQAAAALRGVGTAISAPRGDDATRERLRHHYGTAADWLKFAGYCVAQRVHGFAGREQEQAALVARFDHLIDRARSTGSAWDIEVAIADRASPPLPVSAPPPCASDRHVMALRQSQSALDEFETTLTALATTSRGQI